MAFGSFFKKIISGAKNIIGKVVPVVKKGLAAVSKIAPAIATGAAALGGPIGATIGSVANTVGNITGGVSQFLDSGSFRNSNSSVSGWSNSNSQSPPKALGAKGNEISLNHLGMNGAGRFAVPMLK